MLNFASFASIAVSYLLMYTAAKNTRKAARDSETPEEPDLGHTSASMGRRMTLIVATDAACWLPIIGLGLASLAGVTIPPQVSLGVGRGDIPSRKQKIIPLLFSQVYAWVAVFVLPLNAAVNPILYTLSTAPVRKRFLLLGETLKSKRKGAKRLHHGLGVSGKGLLSEGYSKI